MVTGFSSGGCCWACKRDIYLLWRKVVGILSIQSYGKRLCECRKRLRRIDGWWLLTTLPALWISVTRHVKYESRLCNAPFSHFKSVIYEQRIIFFYRMENFVLWQLQTPVNSPSLKILFTWGIRNITLNTFIYTRLNFPSRVLIETRFKLLILFHVFHVAVQWLIGQISPK